MTKRTVGIIFICLATLLFLSRYIFALWYRGDGQTWGSENFSEHLRYVGVLPWFIAAAFLIAGIFYLVRTDSEE